ncbi:MAG: tetratricopeptide repeat protein [Acidobacteria bacterium]|nr:MAG: tetratricopeptide repeat protein [Acidobacteriota bacterium]
MFLNSSIITLLPFKKFCFLAAAVLFFVSMAFGQTRNPSAQISEPQESLPYRRALNLLKIHKAQEALAVIHTGLDKNPSDWKLYDLQGLAESSMGRPDQAEASFQKVIELAPKRALGYADLGVLFLQMGKAGEAGRLFKLALDREPGNFTALLGLGTILLGSNRAEEAAGVLKNAWSSNPASFRAGYEYALALRELKRPQEGQEVLSKTAAPAQAEFVTKYYALSGALAEDLQNWSEAARAYARAYRSGPGEIGIYSSWVRAAVKSRNPDEIRALSPPPAGLSVQQHLSLGTVFSSAGAYKQAVPEFSAALQADPDNEAAAYNLAVSYQQAGNPREAISVVQAAVHRKPSAELYNLLGSLEEGSGDYVQAAHDLRQAVDLNPKSEEYYFDLGIEYLSHYAFRPALDVFEVADRKFPGSLREKVGLGYANYGLHQYSEAEKAFVGALEINPSAPAAVAAWNTLTSFLTPDEYQKISGRLRQLAEANPSSAEALYYCGFSIFQSGQGMGKPADLTTAEEYLERALSLKPDYAVAYLALGTIYASRNDFEKAISQFLEAVRLDPESAMIHYQLGQAYRKTGKLKLAQQELDQYSSLAQQQQSQMAHYQTEIKKFIVSETPSNHK